jgi:hypothetical protein
MKTAGTFSTPQGSPKEHITNYQHSLISWKPIFAGLFLTVLIHATLMALGIAIGGATISQVIDNGGTFRGLATGSAIWFGVSALLSLAAGSYFAARTSTYITGRVGAAQGITIAAIFFVIMLSGVGVFLGGLGATLGAGSMNITSSPVMQNAIEDSLGNLDLNSDTDVVISGLLTRLLQGHLDAAKAYLGNQTDLTSAELDSRFAALQDNFRDTLRAASSQAASAASKSALSIFIILVVGGAASLIGGALGARLNFTKPLADESQDFVPQPIGMK